MEEQLMHRPEEPLRRCSLGEAGGCQRVRVDLRQREVSEDEAQRPVLGLQLLDVAKGLAGVGALVVAVLQDDHSVTAAPMIARGIERTHELAHPDTHPTEVKSRSRRAVPATLPRVEEDDRPLGADREVARVAWAGGGNQRKAREAGAG